MLLEDLLALPARTQVYGDIENFGMLAGVIESHPDGFRFIRWADGFITIPFGRVREWDEYIAAHTRLTPTHPAGQNAEQQDGAEHMNQRSAEVCHA